MLASYLSANIIKF